MGFIVTIVKSIVVKIITDTILRRITTGCLAVVGLTTLYYGVDANFAYVQKPMEHTGYSTQALKIAQLEPTVVQDFRISGDDTDHSKDNVRLYEFLRAVNGGKDLPNIPQQIGDCVSWGARNAMTHLLAIQLAREGGGERFSDVYPPFIYGASRHQIGGDRISGDGSVGVWAVKALAEYGVLPWDENGVPAYDGKVARAWGKSGPPEKWLTKAEPYKLKSYAKVTSAQKAMEAVCNFYTITIASNFGTKTLSNKDNRWVAKGDDSWNHQMSVIAYDGSSPSGQKYFLVLNSWGPNEPNKKPLQNEPLGSFWITWEQMDRICKQGDTWALSATEGFPLQQIKFTSQAQNLIDIDRLNRSNPLLGMVQKIKEMIQMAAFLIVLAALFMIAATCIETRGKTRLIIIGFIVALVVIAYQKAHAQEPVFYRMRTTRVDFQRMATPSPKEQINLTRMSGSITSITSSLPPDVIFYCPTWCQPCKRYLITIGGGDATCVINYIVGPVNTFPTWVQETESWPLIYFPTLEKSTTPQLIGREIQLTDLKSILNYYRK